MRKCGNCGTKIPLGWWGWEAICPNCGRRYPEMRVLVGITVAWTVFLAYLVAVAMLSPQPLKELNQDLVSLVFAAVMDIYFIASIIVLLERRRAVLA